MYSCPNSRTEIPITNRWSLKNFGTSNCGNQNKKQQHQGLTLHELLRDTNIRSTKARMNFTIILFCEVHSRYILQVKPTAPLQPVIICSIIFVYSCRRCSWMELPIANSWTPKHFGYFPPTIRRIGGGSTFISNIENNRAM